MNLCSAYQRILPRLRVLLILVAAMLMGGASVLAQWQTQSIPLKAGWNAVYLHVDPSHATIEDLVAYFLSVLFPEQTAAPAAAVMPTPAVAESSDQVWDEQLQTVAELDEDELLRQLQNGS